MRLADWLLTALRNVISHQVKLFQSNQLCAFVVYSPELSAGPHLLFFFVFGFSLQSVVALFFFKKFKKINFDLLIYSVGIFWVFFWWG